MHYLLAAVFAIIGTSAGGQSATPAPLVSRWTGQPLFIAASDLVDTSGNYAVGVPTAWQELNDSFARHSLEVQGKNRQSEDSPCVEGSREVDAERLASRRDAREIVDNATAIFYGRVRSVTPGLFYGAPGSLLELGEVQVIKRGPYSRVDDVLYVRHPYAKFSLRKTDYCRLAADDRNRPRPGDEVIAFAFEPPVDQSGTFVHTFQEDLVMGGEGRLLVPAVFREYSGRDKPFEAIRRAVQHQALHRSGGAK